MTAAEVMALIRASDKPYYCYILRRPDGRPFYVGVGAGERLIRHERAAKKKTARGHKPSIIRGIWQDGGAVGYEVVGFFDTWEEAAQLERKLISQLGRIDLGTGPLANMTDGGEGCPGRRPVFTPEWRKRMSEAAKARKRTPQDIEQAREMGRRNGPIAAARNNAKWKDPEYRARMSKALRGVKRSEKYCIENKVRSKALWADPEFRARAIAAKNAVIMTPEHRAKRSALLRAKWADPEFRARILAARRSSRSKQRNS